MALFLVDEDGDFQYDGADGGAYDAWEDATLLRAFTHATADPASVVRSKWDEMVKYQESDLVEADILGYCSPEDRAKGHRPLVNGAALDRALVGEVWQGYCRDMELAERVTEQEDRIETLTLALEQAQKQIRRLTN